jgi:hypothetical protein
MIPAPSVQHMVDQYNKDLSHFDILTAGPGLSRTVAYYTSGNQGQLGSTVSSGSVSAMDLPEINSRWHVPFHAIWIGSLDAHKDDRGCWKIVEFTFNEGHNLFLVGWIALVFTIPGTIAQPEARLPAHALPPSASGFVG